MKTIDIYVRHLFQGATESIHRKTGLNCFICGRIVWFVVCLCFVIGSVYTAVSHKSGASTRILAAFCALGFTWIAHVGFSMIDEVWRETTRCQRFRAPNRNGDRPLYSLLREFIIACVVFMLFAAAWNRDLTPFLFGLLIMGVDIVLYLCACTPLGLDSDDAE